VRTWFSVLIVCVVLGTSLPASAQSELDTARKNAKEAAEAADEARDAADDANLRAEVLAGEIDVALDLVLDVEQDVERVAGRAQVARAERDALKESVAELMVQRYVFIERGVDLVPAGGVGEQVRADALAKFASLGLGGDVDRYRVIEDDLAAAEAELVSLGIEREGAALDLEAKDRQLSFEIEEMVRLLTIADEREAEFDREVGRLEEEERLRLEAERRAAEKARREAREAARRQAQAEADRQREAEAQRAAEEAARNPTTTVPTTTVTTTTVVTPGQPDDGQTNNGTDASSTTTATPAAEPEPDLRGSGGFLCPIGGPTSFADTWGAARSGGRSHKGVDMFATRGTPIVAPVGGVVRHSSSSRLAGLAFYLEGDDGNTYFGAHMDSFGASGRVEAGTVIGSVGNSGNARFSSTHLHFEIKPGGGSSVNPTPKVRAACG